MTAACHAALQVPAVLAQFIDYNVRGDVVRFHMRQNQSRFQILEVTWATSPVWGAIHQSNFGNGEVSFAAVCWGTRFHILAM